MRSMHAWFNTALGRTVVDAECRFLSSRLAGLYARTILQIGGYGAGEQPAVFGDARQWLTDDHRDARVDVTCDCRELPFASDSLDVVILVHQLEFSAAPHDVLREAARVVAPEGHLITLGFNPVSFWGLRRLFSGRQAASPWRGHYLGRTRVEDWLRVLGLAIENRDGLLLRPPVTRASTLSRLAPLEQWGRHYARWLGGVHVTIARKRVAGATPLPEYQRPRLAVIPGGLAQARARHEASRSGS